MIELTIDQPTTNELLDLPLRLAHLTENNIPLTDEEAWKMYPNLRWVYSTSRLLDMQHIEWAPFVTGKLDFPLSEFNSFSSLNNSSIIYVNELKGNFLTTDVTLLKGEIKWAVHYTADSSGIQILDHLTGDIELRISAMAALHFKKFAGVISVDTIGTVITSARLHLTSAIVDKHSSDWTQRVVRIYNRRSWGK